MQRAGVVDPLAAGKRALESGDWLTARDAFAAAATRTPKTAEAWEGLASACWWLGDLRTTLEARTRAYATLRRQGRFDEAARTAVQLSREHRTLSTHSPVADGWLARARRTAALSGTGTVRGWLLLAEAERSVEAADALNRLEDAIAEAGRTQDSDLEIIALARHGVTRVAVGLVEEGLTDLDEAMAAATAGEAQDPATFGEACCALLEAAALLAEADRLSRWSDAIATYQRTFAVTPLGSPATGEGRDVLAAFCSTCCGGFNLVTGRLDEAEAALEDALRELESQGVEARCVHPAANLAELRLLQGRVSDAAALLARYEEYPECARPLAALDLARGAGAAAVERLHLAIQRLGDRQVAAVPLLELLVDAELTRDNVTEARLPASQLAGIARLTGSARHRAIADFAAAKVTAATAPAEALGPLRASSQALAAVQAPLDACRARLAYARALAPRDPATAAAEARGALSALERLGAVMDADSAAAFLRELGVRSRTGPRGAGLLSQRETQVLRLIAEGLSNREIAEQLRISAKTAGHHVSRILAKLGARSRTEAAAWALLHLDHRGAR